MVSKTMAVHSRNQAMSPRLAGGTCKPWWLNIDRNTFFTNP